MRSALSGFIWFAFFIGPWMLAPYLDRLTKRATDPAAKEELGTYRDYTVGFFFGFVATLIFYSIEH